MSPRSGIYGAWQLPPSLAWELSSLVGGEALGRTAEPPGIYSIIDTASHVGHARGMGYEVSPPGSTFTLSGLLREWSNPILNELFFDLRPSLIRGVGIAPSMVMREYPFPVYQERAGDSAWAHLPVVDVPATSVIDLDLGRDGADRYNAFSFMPQAEAFSQVEQKGLYPPTFAPGSIRRHGMRRYEVGTRFASALWSDEFKTEAQRWLWLMHSWHGPGPELKSGSVELRGAWPNIRIGRRLRIGQGSMPASDPNQINAYIQGVDRSWDPESGWTTTATLERGYDGRDIFVQQIVAFHFSDLRSVIAEETQGSTGGAAPKNSGVTDASALSTWGSRLGLEPTTVIVPGAWDVLSGPQGATLGGRSSSPGAGFSALPGAGG